MGDMALNALAGVIATEPFSATVSRAPVAKHDASVEKQARAIVSAARSNDSHFCAPEALLYVPRAYKFWFRRADRYQARQSIKDLADRARDMPRDENVWHCIVGLFAYALLDVSVGEDVEPLDDDDFGPLFYCDQTITLASSVRIWHQARDRLVTLRALASLCKETHQMVMSAIAQSKRLALSHYVVRGVVAPPLWSALEPQDVELLIHFLAISSLRPHRKIVLLDAIPETCGVPRATTAMPRARIVECLLQMRHVTAYGDVVLETMHRRTQVSGLHVEVTFRANAYACSCPTSARAPIFL